MQFCLFYFSFYFSLLYFHWLVVVAAMAIHQPSLSPEQSNCIHTEKICNGGQYNAIQCNSIRYYTTCNTVQLHLSPDLSNCIHREKICNAKQRNPVHFIGNSLFSDRSCCCIPGGCHRIKRNLGKKRNQEQKTSQILFREFLQDNQGHRDRIYQSVWESSVRTMTKGVI